MHREFAVDCKYKTGENLLHGFLVCSQKKKEKAFQEKFSKEYSKKMRFRQKNYEIVGLSSYHLK